MPESDVRHILGLSGGKDSAALAVLLHDEIPELEYFFCDTAKELPETYEFLDRLKARLGIEIKHLSADRGFDHWMKVYGGLLPSPKMRWCTKQLKIKPLEEFVGDDRAISYIGIRADEDNRKGYISTKGNIESRFPFVERGLVKADIVRLLEDSGVGLPKYYQWRSRSGCFFCFYQRKIEWVRLADEHPELFQRAVEYEQEQGGVGYTWTPDETLLELIERRDQIEHEHEEAQRRAQQRAELTTLPNRPLAESLGSVLDGDEGPGCVICHV